MNSLGRIDMGKKQLNLSAPLLSARRYSSPLRSSVEEITKESLPARTNSFPANKSDVKLGEVVKPGAVPFVWEQIPGRAKGGANSQIHSPEEPANTPRLPPGRTPADALPRVSGVKSGELSFLRPYHKLSGELNLIRLPTKFLSGELPLLRAQNRPSSFPIPVHDAVNSAQLNVAVNHKASDSGSDTDDVPFSDALDALESYSMNCSTGGLSASEFPITKPCSNSSADVGNRDFMMNRFLPAAKAMTLESPQYASKRQIVAVEPPQLSKVIVPKIVKGPSHPVPEKNMAITLYAGQDIGSAPSEDEEDDGGGGYNDPRNIPVKSCGFFPWFCSKSALRLLNPVPAMKIKTKSALASATKVGRLVKNASYKSPSRTNSKQAPPTHHKHKVDHVTKSCELNHVESKPKTKSRPMFYSGELPTRNGNLQARNALSPYRNYKRSSVSPCRNESPYSPFHSGGGHFIVPKRVDQPDEYKSKTMDRASNTSGPMSFHRWKLQGSCPGSPVAEKTLYVDSVNIIRGRQSSGRMDIMKARGMSKTRGGSGTVDINTQRSSIECQTDVILSKMNQSFRSSNVVGNGHVNSSRELVLRAEDPAMHSPLPPPLPKSPSESWLSRSLNAVSPRNSVSHSHGGNKFQPRQQAAAQTQAPINGSTKWETIVKSSHLRWDHGRFSEELVARVPQQSRTSITTTTATRK